MMEKTRVGETLVVIPDGDIVASVLDSFRAELSHLIEDGNVRLAIDLAHVSMIDSKGLAVLMLCHKTLTERGGSLVVVTDNADFQQLFRIMRMDEHFTVTASLPV